jgi:hypothetical protein
MQPVSAEDGPLISTDSGRLTGLHGNPSTQGYFPSLFGSCDRRWRSIRVVAARKCFNSKQVPAGL